MSVETIKNQKNLSIGYQKEIPMPKEKYQVVDEKTLIQIAPKHLWWVLGMLIALLGIQYKFIQDFKNDIHQDMSILSTSVQHDLTTQTIILQQLVQDNQKSLDRVYYAIEHKTNK